MDTTEAATKIRINRKKRKHEAPMKSVTVTIVT